MYLKNSLSLVCLSPKSKTGKIEAVNPPSEFEFEFAFVCAFLANRNLLYVGL